MMAQGSTAKATAPRMTLAEWANLDEDEDRSGELVDGQLVAEEDVGAEHDIVGGWIFRLLGNWLAARGGFIGVSDTRFGVTRTRGRKPDLYAYFAGRRPSPRGLVTVPPDIMVEVVSPTPRDARRDRVEKMREYAAFGVHYYWIVDPALRTVEICELGSDGRYAFTVGVTEGVIDPVPGCDGFTLDVDALWAEADRLAEDDSEG